jgi:5'-phosphate synthase pdxT subunit
MQMKIGVIGLQGAVEEHVEATKRAMEKLGIQGEVFWICKPEEIEGLNGIIIPGGESTTIGKLLVTTRLFEKIRTMALNGVPILGTCAGMILLAKEGDERTMRAGQPLLGLMDMRVIRNAFGRQRESFEVNLEIPAFGEAPFPCVFIRAPVVEKVWGDAEVMARCAGKIVAVKQHNMLALAFHPELTTDTRAHEYFLQMCKR